MCQMCWGGEDDPDDWGDEEEVEAVYEYYQGENSMLYEYLRNGMVEDLDDLSELYTGAWIQSGGLANLIMNHAAEQGWLDWTQEN